MKYKEPIFMRELHKQRERDARELYTVFGGDMKKWWNFKMGCLKENLQKGYRLQSGKRGIGRMVQEQNARGRKK